MYKALLTHKHPLFPIIIPSELVPSLIHQLYILDGKRDYSGLHLIHSILRERTENGEEYLILKDVNHDEVLACPISEKLLSGEKEGEPVYLKPYHWTMSSLAKKMLNR